MCCCITCLWKTSTPCSVINIDTDICQEGYSGICRHVINIDFPGGKTRIPSVIKIPAMKSKYRISDALTTELYKHAVDQTGRKTEMYLPKGTLADNRC